MTTNKATTPPLTGAELDKLEALARDAMPGPWEVQIDERPHYHGGVHHERRIATTWEHGQLKGKYPVVTTSVGIGKEKDGPPHYMVGIREEDAKFIAALNPETALALIAQARAQQETAAPAVVIWPSEKFVHERIATLMAGIGMANDTPLWNAFSTFEADLRSRVESVAPSDATGKADAANAGGLTAQDTVRRLTERLKWMLDADQFRNVAAMLSAIEVPEWVYRSARDLSVSIWRDNYKATAPQWEPLDDLAGVISQIDNMVAGMRLVAAAGEAHSDDLAVDRFAAVMKAKMAVSRAKGRGGWGDAEQCPTERLQSMLVEHIAKGDPADVGNFAMMLWNRGERTATSAADAKDAEPVISSYDIEKVKKLKYQFVDSLIHNGIQYRTCGAISATLNRIIDDSERAAQQAQSSAKGGDAVGGETC